VGVGKGIYHGRIVYNGERSWRIIGLGVDQYLADCVCRRWGMGIQDESQTVPEQNLKITVE
jgi:hypothetical protein